MRLEGLPKNTHQILVKFFQCYREAVGRDVDANIEMYIQLLSEQLKTPYAFEPYHKKIRHPIDYYRFSLDFIRPLIDLPHSKVTGLKILDQIDEQLRRNENVVLLANHQTETDPQAIAILLEKTHPHIAEKIIYVAGERVVTDPLAIPFSMGCDLLCIYSKRYIDYPPELKAQKLLHNKNTMELMSRLLREGGKIIYVAPSGGRDRRNAQGVVEVAPFDPPSIEMFYLMARKAKTATHFYPFTLSTYDLLPPPETIQKELGEARLAKRCPIQIAFAPAFDMEIFPGSEENEKTIRRKARADAIWHIVDTNYKRMTASCSTHSFPPPQPS
ncbi:MAG TPA: 1-acyl-sn-glycerol-3-phosphate acyltransferase [Chlamydiales bacterium]|nr:1-acyl-sn-glycerol-3-phosphate acyltransferase [Chlamydiales bacterium]